MKSNLGIVSSGNAGGVAAFDPIDAVAWAHAYWTEGPEFQALALADGDPISTWPDEVSTYDLTQTSTSRPIYRAAHSPLGSKPAADMTTTQFMTSSTPSIAQPWTLVAVAEGVDTSTLLMGYTSDTLWAFFNNTGQWQATAGAIIGGGTADAFDHLFVFIANGASSKIIVDGSTIVTGNAGTSSIASLRFGGLGGSFQPAGGAAFIGLVDAALTAGELDDLHAWAQDHYGTP